MSQSTISGKTIIQSLSREKFHHKFVKGVCNLPSIGALASFRAENISPEEKLEIRNILANNGIPYDLTETDHDLNEIILAISDRAMSLR